MALASFPVTAEDVVSSKKRETLSSVNTWLSPSGGARGQIYWAFHSPADKLIKHEGCVSPAGSKKVLICFTLQESKKKKKRKRQTSDPNQSKSWMRRATWNSACVTSCCHCYWTGEYPGNQFPDMTRGWFSRRGKEPEKGWEEQKWGRQRVLARTQSPRRFVILLRSVTMLAICLDACILWISKCFGKVTTCYHVLEHQELKTVFHKSNLQFDVLVLWGTTLSTNNVSMPRINGQPA